LPDDKRPIGTIKFISVAEVNWIVFDKEASNAYTCWLVEAEYILMYDELVGLITSTLNEQLNVWVWVERVVVKVTPVGLTVELTTCGEVMPVIKVKQLEADESNAVSVAVEQIK